MEVIQIWILHTGRKNTIASKQNAKHIFASKSYSLRRELKIKFGHTPITTNKQVNKSNFEQVKHFKPAFKHTLHSVSVHEFSK